MLENPRSPKVRRVSALQKKRDRQESGQFLLEGPQAVREALTAQPELLLEVFATPTAHEKHADIRALLSQHDIEIEFISEAVLAAMTDTVTPQGFVAVCAQFPKSLKDVLAAKPRLIAVLEEVRDPGNAGTIIRSADAAGAEAVVFAGKSIDVYNPKVVRATTGSLFHVDVSVAYETEAALAEIRSVGLRVVAADVSGRELNPDTEAELLSQPTAWLFGNEARGLTPELLALADDVVRLPIFGSAESLNLATAASVCLYLSAFAQAPARARAK